jgi:tRNA(fMet)-specific endonuclease VapC
MTEYVLDTNICIYIIKKKPANVFNRFKKLTPGMVGISSITLAEMQYGIAKSSKPGKNQAALDQFLLPLDILEFTALAAMESGKIRSSLEKAGTPIGSLDMLIAAQVKSVGAVLVTNNTKEFNRVYGLKIENWARD